eukprot:TRINITY_DN1917_c0_g1_i2.p3 TRINITY_DN1917_c0_g1~~TRINITY_DN1917_c0_g1_i2.p3  ORF type:complete len:156 (-),score=2.98 TRINITY_DN1917_c0_g1_i2:396-863(-)
MSLDNYSFNSTTKGFFSLWAFAQQNPKFNRLVLLLLGQTRFFEKFPVLTEGIDLFQIITFIFVDIIVVFSKEVRKKMRYSYQYTSQLLVYFYYKGFFFFVGICLTKSKIQQIGFITVFQLFELSIIYPQKNIKQINKGFLQPPSLQKLVEALCLS